MTLSHAVIVEHRRLAPRERPNPIAIIRAAIGALQDVPRESLATKEDMLFHNRRVAKKIAEAADRLEVEWEPAAAKTRSAPRCLPASRETRREITAAKGRRVRVVERGKCGRQMELSL